MAFCQRVPFSLLPFGDEVVLSHTRIFAAVTGAAVGDEDKRPRFKTPGVSVCWGPCSRSDFTFASDSENPLGPSLSS